MKKTTWLVTYWLQPFSLLCAELLQSYKKMFCSQESQEMVGGSTCQPPGALPSMGLAASLESWSVCSCCYGDHIPLSPNPPGWDPGDGTHPPPGVQQRELHGAGRNNFSTGERRKGAGGHCVFDCVCLCMWQTDVVLRDKITFRKVWWNLIHGWRAMKIKNEEKVSTQ